MEIIDFYRDAWDEGWLDFLLALVMTAIGALVLFVVACGLFIAADSWFIADRDGVAEVVARHHEASWTEMQPVASGKATTYVFVTHPETWSVTFELDHRTDAYDVDSYIFHTVPDGRRVPVRYRHGRFSEGLYITGADFTEH